MAYLPRLQAHHYQMIRSTLRAVNTGSSSAFDSETQERMVVYQALYGDQAYWVRPEDMFFGKVTRDGRTFNRFTEIDKF